MLKLGEQKVGAGLIEVVIGVGILTLTVVGLTTSYGLFIKSASAQSKFVKAQFLLEEGVEALRTLRDESWSSFGGLTKGTTYWISFDNFSSSWDATSTQVFVDGEFERTFILDEVFRDGSDRIASSGTLDPGTIKVTVNVEWQFRNATNTSSVETYFANLFE